MQSIDEHIEFLRSFLALRFDVNLADARRSLPPHIFLELGRRRYFGMLISREKGGLGLSFGSTLRLLGVVSSVDLSIAVSLAVHNILGLRALERHAAPLFYARIADDCIRGARLCVFALTESEAGSALRRISTTATEQADGSWILKGTKRWIGLGAWSGAVVTFAQATDRAGVSLGLTGFAFESETPGFRVGREAVTMGLRGMFQGEVHFDSIRLNKSCVLGLPGGGLEQAKEVVAGGRLACVAFSVGAMRSAVKIAVAYAHSRKISTGLMLNNGQIKNILSKILAKTSAVERFFEWCCDEYDKGGGLSELVCIAGKIVAPEWAFGVVDTCMQLLGGRGYEEANSVARIFRDIRVVRIFEGPTEAMAHHLGGLVWRDSQEIEDLLVRILHAPDVYEEILNKLSSIRAGNRDFNRADLERVLASIGNLAAYSVFWAIVRRGMMNSPISRIAEEYVKMQMEDSSLRCQWADDDELSAMVNNVCDGPAFIAHWPGEKWEPDQI